MTTTTLAAIGVLLPELLVAAVALFALWFALELARGLAAGAGAVRP